MLISANLGLLFADRPLPERIRAAASAGFGAVEAHFPYDTPIGELSGALADTGLEMLALNTRPGDLSAGEFGLAALPGREGEARAAIDEAIDYGQRIGAAHVHVMAGRSGGGEGAEDAYRRNLAHACDAAARRGMSILIEPLNSRDVPGYHLSTVEHAARVIEDVGRENLRIMFDCYHVQIMQGDLTERLRAHLPLIGHVQIAGVPDRAEPDDGEVHYPNLLRALRGMGYTGAVGAEYRPAGARTEDGLAWLAKFRRELS